MKNNNIIENPNQASNKSSKHLYNHWEFWVITFLVIIITIPPILQATGIQITISKHSKSSKSLKTNTKNLSNAIKDAEDYAMEDISKQEIYELLSSDKSYGKHYSFKTARKAVDQLKVDWNKKALNKAQSMVEDGVYSKKYLYKTLSSNITYKFTASEAKYAVDHISKVDWNQMALEEAKDQLSNESLSKKGLYRALTDKYSQEFSPSEAKYAIDHVEVDWNQQAIEAAKDEIKYSSNSKKSLYDDLISKRRQFEPSQAQYAVDNVEVDWNQQALTEAKNNIKLSPLSKSGLYDSLTDKYSKNLNPIKLNLQ